jgi:hypothetical protein
MKFKWDASNNSTFSKFFSNFIFFQPKTPEGPTRAVASLDPSTAGGSKLTAHGALRDCPPRFALDLPPMIALKPRLFACRVLTALLALLYPSYPGSRTCQARRWPNTRPLPRPSRRSLRKLRDRTSVGPPSFGHRPDKESKHYSCDDLLLIKDL